MTPGDKTRIYFEALLDTKIEEDLTGAVVTAYHQCNDNILSLLECARTEEAMKKLIENRLNPLKYQQKDPNAIIKEGHIDNAEKLLGEFENSIFSHEELSNLPYCISINDKCNSTMNAFSKMRMDSKEKKSNSFASKCRKLNTKSISELIDYLSENPNLLVEIMTLKLQPVYVANTTLFPEKTDYPHLWCFTNEFDVKRGWCKVKYILPMYKYIKTHKNIAFILETENIINRNKIKNCCLPEFLKTKYNKHCGVAFQRINSYTQISMKHKDLALGVGISVTNHKLVPEIKIRVNGEELFISAE
jgi:hypothetical protein